MAKYLTHFSSVSIHGFFITVYTQFVLYPVFIKAEFYIVYIVNNIPVHGQSFTFWKQKALQFPDVIVTLKPKTLNLMLIMGLKTSV